jgi:histone H3/H4
MDISTIPGTRAEAIANMVREILETRVSDAVLAALCKAIEKLTDAAYDEGRQDGLWAA